MRIIFFIKGSGAASLCWVQHARSHSSATRSALCTTVHPKQSAFGMWILHLIQWHVVWRHTLLGFLTKSPDSLYHFIPGVTLAESVELSWPGYDLYICCTACCSNFRTGISQWPWHAFCSLLFLAVLMNTSFLSKGSRCGPLDYPHGWWLPNSF